MPSLVPVVRPTIEINGNVSPVLGQALLELAVVDDGVGPTRCEARFGNWGTASDGSPGYPARPTWNSCAHAWR